MFCSAPFPSCLVHLDARSSGCPSTRTADGRPEPTPWIFLAVGIYRHTCACSRGVLSKGGTEAPSRNLFPGLPAPPPDSTVLWISSGGRRIRFDDYLFPPTLRVGLYLASQTSAQSPTSTIPRFAPCVSARTSWPPFRSQHFTCVSTELASCVSPRASLREIFRAERVGIALFFSFREVYGSKVNAEEGKNRRRLGKG